jgi:hypothetical protein
MPQVFDVGRLTLTKRSLEFVQLGFYFWTCEISVLHYTAALYWINAEEESPTGKATVGFCK